MADETQGNPDIQVDNNSIAFESVRVDGPVEGHLIIGSNNVVGFTAEQASAFMAQLSEKFTPRPFDGSCPYKGLAVFEEEDADVFFGRENLVQDLVRRVRESCMVFITGPSGSGKSSVVRAGLIHALKRGALPYSEKWLYATMKPGREPISMLARATAGLVMSTNAEDEIRARALDDESIFSRWCEIALKDGSDKRVVLFIDQFEEIFTQVNQDKERAAFLSLLTCATSAKNSRVIVLFSMRSDFISNCAAYPELNALLNKQFVQVGAMQPEELVSAIAQPALRVGLKIDPDLTAQIINDMRGEPGVLPLMQFALRDLFDAEQAKGGIIALTLKDYLARGGIHKALERHADNVFTGFSEKEQDLARSIFSRLIEIGRGTQDTRRTAILDELVPSNVKSEDVDAIVLRLADARLITTDEIGGRDTVTISHEKLIDAWPWLKKLVNENRDVIALQNEIDEDAIIWEDHGRDVSYLYSGARLANAREKLAENKLTLSEDANEFVQAGFRKQQQDQLAKILVISGVVVFVIAGIALFSFLSTTNAKNLAEQSRNAASTQAVIANTAQAASTLAVANDEKVKKQAQMDRILAQSVSLRGKNFLVSLLLGVQVFKENTEGLLTYDMVQSTLLDNAKTSPQLEQFLSGHSDSVISVAFSPDGKTIASGGMDNTIILWDVETHQPIGEPLEGHTDIVRSVAFSPDGKTLASGSEDETIILWSVKTRQPIGRPLSGHANLVTSVAFSPDGKTLASGSDDKTIILWDVETGKPSGEPLSRHIGPISTVAFSPDGKTLVSGSEDTTIILWDLESRQPIGEPLPGYSGALPGPVLSVAFSPDGKMLASGGYDKTILLWDVETRERIGQPLKWHSDIVRSVAFSPDGETLASGSYDRTILLWDVESRQPIGQPLSGHGEIVTSVAFSPDGKTLVSSSGDKTIALWDVEPRVPLGRPLSGHAGPVTGVAFSPDGKMLASASIDSTIILWDVKTGRRTGDALRGHAGPVNTVAFSPDSKTLASGGVDGTVILWDMITGKQIGQPLTGHEDPVNSVVFSPDGKMLASGSDDKTIILWDVKTGKPIGQPLKKHSDLVLSIAFSPDGKMLASGSEDKTIILWDVESRQPIGQPWMGHDDIIRSVAFSPDGKTLVSGSESEDKKIILWDVETGRPIGQPLSGHSNLISSIVFSPDGKMLASGSYDQTIIVWDVATRKPIGEPLSGHSAPVNSVAFSPDGKTLASSSYNIILWDPDPQSWMEKSCQRAGRNFTRSEWQNYFPNEGYQQTCPQFLLEPAASQ